MIYDTKKHAHKHVCVNLNNHVLARMMGMIDYRETLTHSPGATMPGLILPSSVGPLHENSGTHLKPSNSFVISKS